ncbi:MAG TPA: sulfite exporter TauE/SafE family protein, partial [Microthrixaceae bacterium]|nr:sulfite exporter TauE/SafE family protein [Microthrixaceae bacterium]
MTRRRLVQAVVAGVAAGLLAGVFGVGGGILMVPALVLVLKMDQRTAHGTSLAAVIPIAAASTLSYALAGEVDWAVALILAIGSTVGAVIGTQLLRVVPQRKLAFLFAMILLATAVRFVVAEGHGTSSGGHSFATQVGLVGAGLGAGILAGLLGVGGGSVLVPVMVVGAGMATVLAKGTSLAVIILTALVGTWRNRSNKNVDLGVAAIAGLSGVASGFLGGVLSVAMPERLADLLFAALLVIVATKMLWDLRRKPAQHD